MTPETPETTALATTVPAVGESTKLANPMAAVAELPGFADAVITPVIMKIIQKTSRETDGSPPGTFKDTLTGQCFRELQIVPLHFQCNPGPRVLFEPGSTFGSDPLCRSDDGIRPSANARQPQCELCKNCKQASWANYQKTKKAPPCKEKAKMLFVERTTGLPYIISFSGRSVQPTKNLLKSIMRLAVMSYSQGIRVALYDFTVKMKLLDVVDEKGAYYQVQFAEIKRVVNPGEFGPLYQELVVTRNALINTKTEEDEDASTPGTASQTKPDPTIPDATEVTDEEVPF
jgi:hypothetical protein